MSGESERREREERTREERCGMREDAKEVRRDDDGENEKEVESGPIYSGMRGKVAGCLLPMTEGID